MTARSLIAVPMAVWTLVSAVPAAAQTQPAATPSTQTPALPAKAHHHKVPNLEMDVDGTGETPPEPAGPTTSTANARPNNDLSGSTGATASTPASTAATFEAPTPLPPASQSTERPPLQPGGLSPDVGSSASGPH